MPLHLGNPVLQLFPEPAAVKEIGERVIISQVFKMRLEPFAFGNIFFNRKEVGNGPSRIFDR